MLSHVHFLHCLLHVCIQLNEHELLSYFVLLTILVLSIV